MFTNYKTYIKGNEWKKLRTVFSSNKCFFCSKGYGLVTHHRHYKTLGEETSEDIVTLCSRCHKSVHFDQYGKKIKRWESGSELYIKARSQGWKIKGWKKQKKVNSFLKRANIKSRKGVLLQL
jgi:5-methylcytosine-specific restriction endonuclease McrA